jgi:DNA-binding SARP family transcriptional activator/tetratricopeptide (TPR) repeat protein
MPQDARSVVWFGVLGPVQFRYDGECADSVLTPRTRTLLAALLCRANRCIGADELVDTLWNSGPPSGAETTLRSHVMRLRRGLGPAGDRLDRVSGGYSIRLDPLHELDTTVFAAHHANARAAVQVGDCRSAVGELSRALALWRGLPLADVTSERLQRDERPALVEAHASAVELFARSQLSLRQPEAAVTALRGLVAQQPHREQAHALLMSSLAADGRRVEALDVYRTLRATLVQELGIEPSTEIRTLQTQILNSDAGRRAVADGRSVTEGERATVPSSPAPRTRSLPRDVGNFTGRRDQVAQILAVLGEPASRSVDGSSTPVIVIDGMGGVGKSSLALHTAHRVGTEFPDGQLYVDLHGHTPGLEPLPAADALASLLRSLGVPPQIIPQDLDERAAFYRDRLAGTRTLILLDDAADSIQLRPLLPDAAGCFVLVTSRRRLSGLNDAHALTLDVLSQAESIALLQRVAGPGRISPDHPDLPMLVELCGYLPLTLRIVASRLRHHRMLSIVDVMEDLREERSRLEHLHDADSGLRAVFASSYGDLAPGAQELFRRFALISGPDFDILAAANLNGTDRRTTGRLLETLVDHNLLSEKGVGRFRLHDLLRAYAGGLCEAQPTDENRQALDRLLVYYVHSVHEAGRHFPIAGGSRRTPTPSATPALPIALSDRAPAAAWLHSNRENLAAASIRPRTGPSSPEQALAIAANIAGFLARECPADLAVTVHRSAVETAHRHGDTGLEALALLDLARSCHGSGDFPAGRESGERSLALYRSLGDRSGQANAEFQLARIYGDLNDSAHATQLWRSARILFRDLGDHLGEAWALSDMGGNKKSTVTFPEKTSMLETALERFMSADDSPGIAHTRWGLATSCYMDGDYREAIGHLQEALAIFQRTGPRFGVASTLAELARAHDQLGDPARARELCEQSISLFEEVGHRFGAANATSLLGAILIRLGDYAAAGTSFERVVAVYTEIGNLHGRANAICELGRISHATGDHDKATSLYALSLAVYQSFDHKQGQAEVLNNIGSLHRDLNDQAAALAAHEEALAFAEAAHSTLDRSLALEGIELASVGLRPA